MKTFLLALFLLISTFGLAQEPTKIRSVLTLPATCNPGDGVQPTDMVGLVVSGVTTAYYCQSTNTWTQFSIGVPEAALKLRVCGFSIGDTSSTTPLTNGNLGPQAR